MRPNDFGEYARRHVFRIAMLLAGALVSLAIAATDLPPTWAGGHDAADRIGPMAGLGVFGPGGPLPRPEGR